VRNKSKSTGPLRCVGEDGTGEGRGGEAERERERERERELAKRSSLPRVESLPRRQRCQRTYGQKGARFPGIGEENAWVSRRGWSSFAASVAVGHSNARRDECLIILAMNYKKTWEGAGTRVGVGWGQLV
jgi:hypothetical protein